MCLLLDILTALQVSEEDYFYNNISPCLQFQTVSFLSGKLELQALL